MSSSVAVALRDLVQHTRQIYRLLRQQLHQQLARRMGIASTVVQQVMNSKGLSIWKHGYRRLLTVPHRAAAAPLHLSLPAIG